MPVLILSVTCKSSMITSLEWNSAPKQINNQIKSNTPSPKRHADAGR